MQDDVSARSAKNIRNKRGQPKTRALQELLNPVFLGCYITDDTFAVTIQVMELPYPFFRDEAAIQKPGAQQGGNPFGIPHISFLAGDVFHMARIYNKFPNSPSGCRLYSVQGSSAYPQG